MTNPRTTRWKPTRRRSRTPQERRSCRRRSATGQLDLEIHRAQIRGDGTVRVSRRPAGPAARSGTGLRRRTVRRRTGRASPPMGRSVARCTVCRAPADDRREDTDGARDHAAASRAAGRSMAPERMASPRMTPVAPVSRTRRRASRSRTPPATRISESADRTTERAFEVGRRRVREHERATPAPTSSPISASTVGGASRRQGNAARRSGRDPVRPPTSRRPRPDTRAGLRVGRRSRS